MNKRIEQIAELLPDGLSQTGLQEVLKLVEGAVDDRVAEEVKLMEAKVSGFLRSKVEQLKDVAQAEIEADDNVLRGFRIYENIRAMVAAEVEAQDVDSAVSKQETKIAELEESLETINFKLTNSLHENSILVNKVESLNESNKSLTENNKLPFKSSESAVVITNETDSSRPSPEAANNIFLTEDVLNLSHNKVN
jgi:small-conductance mechanosensitive channel